MTETRVVRTFVNPIVGAPGVDHGDPFIIKFLDSYYLYHSGDTSGRRGISVHRSQNLVEWEFCGYALEAARSGWAYSDIWAPEVVYERGTFNMYVSATSHGCSGAADGDDESRRVGLARGSSPLGPFVWDDEPLADVWAIDAHPFRDDDGTMWLFYNVRTDETRFGDAIGTGTVSDRLVAPDRLEGDPTPVTFPSAAWEGPYGDWYWNEAPYVLKRRGVFYQLYSGGFFGDASYAIGVASARSPRGPWEKDPRNPIFSSKGRILGPGHNSFVYGPDASTRYAVYHAYVAGDTGRDVHLDRLRWSYEGPSIDGPTGGPQPVPADAVYDASIPHWRGEAWVRGGWIEIAGARLDLSPAGVWHQVEAIEAGGRLSVRIGGVLRSSLPADVTSPEQFVHSDGDVTAVTVSSFLEDGAVHGLPAGSEYVWRWGDSPRMELEISVRGEAALELDGSAHELGGDPDRFVTTRVHHDGPVPRITVRAGAGGATVTDLFVYARD